MAGNLVALKVPCPLGNEYNVQNFQTLQFNVLLSLTVTGVGSNVNICCCFLSIMKHLFLFLLFIFVPLKTLLAVPERPVAVIPVFNIPKTDFCLRTEALFLFKRFQLDPSYFIFVEDVNLQNLLETKKLQLILVDHNILAKTQKHMDVAVIEILGRCITTFSREKCQIEG